MNRHLAASLAIISMTAAAPVQEARALQMAPAEDNVGFSIRAGSLGKGQYHRVDPSGADIMRGLSEGKFDIVGGRVYIHDASEGYTAVAIQSGNGAIVGYAVMIGAFESNFVRVVKAIGAVYFNLDAGGSAAVWAMEPAVPYVTVKRGVESFKEMVVGEDAAEVRGLIRKRKGGFEENILGTTTQELMRQEHLPSSLESVLLVLADLSKQVPVPAVLRAAARDQNEPDQANVRREGDDITVVLTRFVPDSATGIKYLSRSALFAQGDFYSSNDGFFPVPTPPPLSEDERNLRLLCWRDPENARCTGH
jgi:hypothetical protein